MEKILEVQLLSSPPVHGVGTNKTMASWYAAGSQSGSFAGSSPAVTHVLPDYQEILSVIILMNFLAGSNILLAGAASLASLVWTRLDEKVLATPSHV